MVLLTPFSQGTHLLSVGCLIIVGDQAYHRCVICKFYDDVGAVCGCTVVCVQGVKEWAEDAALRSTSVEDQGRSGVAAHSDFCLSGSPGSSCAEICLVPEFGASQPVWQALWCYILNYSPRTGFSHRCSYFPGGREQCAGEGNSIVCGTVAEICKL